jgi:hypothetical protein
MHPEVERNIRPNRGERWPWEGHVHPLAHMSGETLRSFVERDRELWEIAERDPDRATRQAIEDRIFFRRLPPRLGEPIYRTAEQAKLDQRNMYCGRGTGHLGTGFYFFGTLRAAADSSRIYEATGDELRELLSAVYAVDMEHVPDDRIFMPGAQETQRVHAFGEAMLCWPRRQLKAVGARGAVLGAQEAAEAAEAVLDRDDSDDAFYAWEEAKEALRDAQVAFRSARASLDITADKLREPGLRPNMFIDEILDIIDEVKDEPRVPREHVYVEPEPTPLPPLMDMSLPEPPPAAFESIERYLDDVAERRFPGFHPMTYYMVERGYEAVLHASWGEFNSGDIGNIWYPTV